MIHCLIYERFAAETASRFDMLADAVGLAAYLMDDAAGWPKRIERDGTVLWTAPEEADLTRVSLRAFAERNGIELPSDF